VLEIWHAAPVEFEYDDDAAICFVLQGEVELESEGTTHRLEVGDVVYLPQQAGLTANWHTPAYARVAYVTYPHWR
jgi:ethanolamine utilization protein EutQ (cupin superfamily)